MKIKIIIEIVILVSAFVACNKKQATIVIDESILPGRYCSNINPRDSIIIHKKGTYVYRYYDLNHDVNEVVGTWNFKEDINSIFFNNFRFYTDSGPDDFSGIWSPRVFISETGELMLQYSEFKYYVKNNTPAKTLL